MPERLISTHRRTMITVTVMSVMMVVAFGLSSYSLYRAHTVSCEGRDKALQVLRDILSDAQLDAQSARIPADRRAALARFYRIELARIDDARC